MIIPASVTKIVGFKEKSNSKRTLKPTSTSNIAVVQLDNGKIIDLTIFSNDKEFSNSLKDFLYSKSMSVVKKSEIKQTAMDIMVDEKDRCSDKIAAYIAQGKTAKEAPQEVARDLVIEKRLLGARSIIKLPIAIGSGNNGEYFNSRSIQVAKNEAGEKAFGTGGIYVFSQTENVLPIEITPITKRSGEFVGYFKVTTSRLINAKQINFLIDHAIRTVSVIFANGKKPFLIQMLKINTGSPVPSEFSSLCSQINQIEAKNSKIESSKKLEVEDYNNYSVLLNSLREYLVLNPSSYQFFKASIPMVIDQKRMTKSIVEIDKEGGQSSLQKMPQAISSLNFSKEDPEIKKAAFEYINSYIRSLSSGNVKFKILSTLQFMAPNIFGESETWGYPVDNIATAKFTLGYIDTYNLINDLYSYIDSMKINGSKDFS